ncbi:putative transposase [Streptomyces sp. Tu6071]|nr:putative transposase [Streptomyces sp. Tu6071]
MGAAPLAVGDLVVLLRDSAANAASAQIGAVRAGAVRLVSPHAVGSDARPSRTGAGHADLLQHRFELW